MGCHRLTYHQKISSKTENTPIFVMGKKQGSDYYLFGMQMPGRSFQSDEYRYGFNGMESDDEISGNGNSYTTEYRHYDPRLGRWKSLDPLMSSFPHISPYAAFANNPIVFTDPYGLAPVNGDGGGEPSKKGDTFIGDDGKEHTLTHDQVDVEVEDNSHIKKLERMPVAVSDRYSDYNPNPLFPGTQPEESTDLPEESIPFGESQDEKEDREWDDNEEDPVFGGWEHGGPVVGPGESDDDSSPSDTPPYKPHLKVSRGRWEDSERQLFLQFQHPRNSLDGTNFYRTRDRNTGDTLWQSGINPETKKILYKGEERYLIDVINEIANEQK